MEKWIKKISQDKNITLNQLILPGTHNSNSYIINNNMYDLSKKYSCSSLWPISKIIKNWTLNQKYNIFSQLKNGVRVLDIDISFYNNQFYTSHTFINEHFNNILNQLKKFNNMYGDLYIIKFRYRYNINSILKNKFDDLLYNNFKYNYIDPNIFQNILNINISNLIQNKKNMIIFLDNTTYFYDLDKIYSTWANKNILSDSILFNKTQLEIIYNMKNNSQSNIFCDFNWTLTPTKDEIINSIICCCNYNNLETWIYDFNSQLPIFINSNALNIKFVNSISLDFIDYDLIQTIININY